MTGSELTLREHPRDQFPKSNESSVSKKVSLRFQYLIARHSLGIRLVVGSHTVGAIGQCIPRNVLESLAAVARLQLPGGGRPENAARP